MCTLPMKFFIKILKNILLVFLISSVLFALDCGRAPVFADQGYIEKTFAQMTADEKDRALKYMLDEGMIPYSVTVKGKKYGLAISIWESEGLITYGGTAVVNSLVQVTNSPNFKEGQWRYWGFDMNGGLYGNDDFPPDVPGTTPPQNKNWLTISQIQIIPQAGKYIGSFTQNIDGVFSNAEKLATANAFLDKNPAWRAGGKDANYIVNHFYFNCVLSDSGLTRGQFVGVHKSIDGNYYYQTFEIKGGTVKFMIPPADDKPEKPQEPDPQEPIPPPSGPGITVNCQLGLPPATYVGHPALASDYSVFDVEGETYSADRAYQEGLASNSFSVAGAYGNARKISNTRAEVTFNQPGYYDVRLSVSPKGGATATDVKPIEVKPTPAIIHSITGTQKQNRKQILNIKIAKEPSAPLKEFWVKITRLDNGEEVILHNRMGAGENILSNSQSIKTRPIERLAGSDSFFENCKLEFLMKNENPVNCRYTIYVKDSKGNWDLTQWDFAVDKDTPPIGKIFIDGAFIRNANSNIAPIIVEDQSITDGDQIERRWFYRPILKDQAEDEKEKWISINEEHPGYGDFSFGTGKKIAFDKENVGMFEVKLIAKDIWTEETLEEYVDDSDRLTGEAIVLSEVINMAPVVSLTPIKMKTANITLLAGGDEELNQLALNKGLLKQQLLEKAIDADIEIAKIGKVNHIPEDKGAQSLMEVRTPFAYEGGWLFYEDQNYIIDDERLIKIDAAWPDGEAMPVSPYTISCWNVYSNRLLWTFTFDNSLMNVPNVRSGPYLSQDQEGRYLFFSANNKTLMLTKDNGSFLTVLNMDIGKSLWSFEDKIFTIKNDGIYSINLKSGTVSNVYKGRIVSGVHRKLEGKIHFLAISGEDYLRGIFDPQNEKASFERIAGEAKEDDSATSYNYGSIDAGGNIILNSLIPSRSSYDFSISGYSNTVKVFGRDNSLKYHTAKSNSSASYYTVTPIYNEEGICTYVGYTWAGGNSGSKHVTAEIRGIYNDYIHSGSVTDKNGYPTNKSSIIFAGEAGGKVYIATGAYWAYIYATGSYGNGPTHGYPERAQLFTFNIEPKGLSMGNLPSVGLNLSTHEYGKRSDSLAAVQTGDNHVHLGVSGSTTRILTWNQGLPSLLNRQVDMYAGGDKDINGVLVYDKTNSAELYDLNLIDGLKEKTGIKNSEFILLNEGDLTEGNLARLILEQDREERNVLKITVKDGAVGQMSKSLEFKPNTTYFYEYDIKNHSGKPEDILKAGFQIQDIYGKRSSGGYKVADLQLEDFNNPDSYNKFFELVQGRISGGRYSGAHAYMSQGKDWSNYYVADGSTLKFTIPEGKKGILSFDFQKMGSGSWVSSYISINGDIWRHPGGATEQGHYLHPGILSSGEHTLYFYAGNYGGRITEAMFIIDNLKVEIIEPVDENSTLPELAETETIGIESLAEDYYRIKGSFNTPNTVDRYEIPDFIEKVSGGIGSAPYTEWTLYDLERENFRFRYNIPAGKTSIYTRVYTSCYLVWSSSRANFQWHNSSGLQSSWSSAGELPYRESILNNIPANYKIHLPKVTGWQEFRGTGSYRDSAYPRFNGIESLLMDSADVNLVRNGFVVKEDEGDFEAYIPNQKFDGGGYISFDFSQGNHLMKDLNIYYLDKGDKVYVEKEMFYDRSALNSWEKDEIEAVVIKESKGEEEEDKKIIHKKNEPIFYGINYFDYEGDPSKKEYWKYIHTPFNDGPNPDAAVILDHEGEVVIARDVILSAPITRFNIDGKYTLEHWQEDNTSRPLAPSGNPDYDKLSNVESLTFYIQGGGSAPWIKSIKTSPAPVKEGRDFKILVEVDDVEKDELTLTTEVYFGNEMIYRDKAAGLRPDSSGNYPHVATGNMPQPAMAGTYEAVCTVMDYGGVGIDSYKFTVISDGKITGRVSHTEEWSRNRKAFNLRYFGEEYNLVSDFRKYIGESLPRKRGVNVFWAGERLMLSADVAGNPLNVTAEILGYPAYKADLVGSGIKNSKGETFYEGVLWNRDMINGWGKSKPEEITVRFTAAYGGGLVKTYDESVIMDSGMDYWLLHRLW